MKDIISASLNHVNSAAQLSFLSGTLKNRGMQKIDEIYRSRLRLLIDEIGSQAKLAFKIGKSAAQISQWVNASADSKTGKPRAMDRSTARDIERLFPKPEGWMDQPLSVAELNDLYGPYRFLPPLDRPTSWAPTLAEEISHIRNTYNEDLGEMHNRIQWAQVGYGKFYEPAMIEQGNASLEANTKPPTDQTLADHLAAVSGYLKMLDAGGRARAGLLLKSLAENPEDHSSIAAMIQAAVNMETKNRT